MRRTLQRYLQKKRMLDEIAEKDEIYLIWKTAYEDSAEKYNKLLRFLPRRTQSVLYSYKECARMMAERKISIACMCMEPNGDTPLDWESVMLTEEQKDPGHI